jgi:hypothetical protein
MHDGVVTALVDNSLIVAGTLTSGSNASPALVRLKSDLTLDTSFGGNGTMLLPDAGGMREASDVAVNPDGTLTAVTGLPRLDDERPAGDLRVDRVFRDDRPVVTFRHSKRQNGQLRLTFSIRGTRPVDTASLDDDDLRLQDSSGRRTKLRLANFVVDPGGGVTATYRVNQSLLAPGAFTIRVIIEQLRDVDGNENASRAIGTVFV